MRALTAEEIEQLIPATGDEGTLSTITIHPPLPAPPPGFPLPPPPPTTGGGSSPIPICPVNPPTTNVNNSTIIANEGGIVSSGYVPGNGTGVGSGSGVTIGGGVDLAYHLGSQLRAWGMTPANLTSVSPYVATRAPKGLTRPGPTGTRAQSTLTANGGLTLPQATVTTVTNNAIAAAASNARTVFGNWTAQNFSNLPSSVQTALTDISYYAGSLAASSLPSGVKSALQATDWNRLAGVLQNSGNARLQRDGNAIAAAIASGTLPLTGAICH